MAGGHFIGYRLYDQRIFGNGQVAEWQNLAGGFLGSGDLEGITREELVSNSFRRGITELRYH